SNQLLSSLNFLKQQELINEGFKVLLHIENDFVQALGFLTPFNDFIKKADINEIIIDSTYKTNQQKFELFAILINLDGYGVPLAYLYVDTFTAPKDLLKNPKNKVYSRLKVLCDFFLSLKGEGILPTFVLMDKDTGQIAVAQEAWDWKILTRELIPDEINTWQRYNHKRDLPSWWDTFKVEWKKALEKEISNEDNYLTNINNW
ncbi:8747_t:CDS:2, partial [Cetraspora pellucida]